MIEFRIGGSNASMFRCEDAEQLRYDLSRSVDAAMRSRHVPSVTIPLGGGEVRSEPRGERFIELKLLAPSPGMDPQFGRRVLFDLDRREPSGYSNHQGEEVFLVRPEYESRQSEDEQGSYGVSSSDARWVWQLAEEAVEASNRHRPN